MLAPRATRAIAFASVSFAATRASWARLDLSASLLNRRRAACSASSASWSCRLLALRIDVGVRRRQAVGGRGNYFTREVLASLGVSSSFTNSIELQPHDPQYIPCLLNLEEGAPEVTSGQKMNCFGDSELRNTGEKHMDVM